MRQEMEIKMGKQERNWDREMNSIEPKTNGFNGDLINHLCGHHLDPARFAFGYMARVE